MRGASASCAGLPLVAGNAVPATWVRRLRSALLAPGARLQDAMAPLRIEAFRHVDDAEYARIARLEAVARAAGYSELA